MTMEMCFIAEPCGIVIYFLFLQNLLFSLDLTIFLFDCCVFYVCFITSTTDGTWEHSWYKPAKHEEACNLGVGHTCLNRAPSFAGERLVHRETSSKIIVTDGVPSTYKVWG